jgi:hypothetical protein
LEDIREDQIILFPPVSVFLRLSNNSLTLTSPGTQVRTAPHSSQCTFSSSPRTVALTAYPSLAGTPHEKHLFSYQIPMTPGPGSSGRGGPVVYNKVGK